MKKEVVTLPQVKKILEAVKPDEMDQIQIWTYDYVRKFAKTDSESAEKMVKRLVMRNKTRRSYRDCEHYAYVDRRTASVHIWLEEAHINRNSGKDASYP